MSVSFFILIYYLIIDVNYCCYVIYILYVLGLSKNVVIKFDDDLNHQFGHHDIPKCAAVAKVCQK